MVARLWRTHTTFILIAGLVSLLIASVVAFVVTTFEPRLPVKLGVMTYQVKVADDEASRLKGLSNVSHLRADEGMLFVFPNEATWGIWMKDMEIPIDILWLDSQGKVIHIVKNASPDIGTSQTFSPKKPARYVLEIPAGSVDKNKFKVGAIAEFDLYGGSQ